jgi:hypothetical protein
MMSFDPARKAHSVGTRAFHAFRLLSLLLLSACASTHKSPPIVIQSFYAAANAGHYDEAAQYYSRELQIIEGIVLGNPLDHPETVFLEPPVDDPKPDLDAFTKNGTLVEVRIDNGIVEGDTATYRVTKRFKDGSTKPAIVELIRDRASGDWKIAWATSTL